MASPVLPIERYRSLTGIQKALLQRLRHGPVTPLPAETRTAEELTCWPDTTGQTWELARWTHQRQLQITVEGKAALDAIDQLANPWR
jgi:hypothetical protein